MALSDASPRERLIDAGSRLFGELGYDQTTSELVAEAANVPVTEISREFGGRRGLYLAVFRRVQEEEFSVLAEMSTAPGLAGVHRFLDRYIDYLAEHPESAALWMQRRLHDAADLREVELTYLLPQIEETRSLVRAAFPPGFDAQSLLWTVAWATHAFILAGIPGIAPDDARCVSRFRDHVHNLVDLASAAAGREDGRGHGCSAP